jgi:hypothetical protein
MANELSHNQVQDKKEKLIKFFINYIQIIGLSILTIFYPIRIKKKLFYFELVIKSFQIEYL